MNNSYRRIFAWEQGVEYLVRQFRCYRVPFLSAMVFGLLAHQYAFSNKLLNYDEVGSLFTKGATAGSGRWGLDLLRGIFPDYSMPWIYGILSILILAAAVCVIVRIFAIRSPGLQALLAGSILVFPSLTATVTYFYTLSSYAVSFLLAVLAVRCWQKGKWSSIFAGLAMAVFSLSIYQSYISIMASFLVLILIQQLLLGEDVTKVLRRGVEFVLCLVVALGTYYVLTRIVNHFVGDLNSYAAQRIQFRLSYLPTGVYEAYRGFWHFFSIGLWGLMPNGWSRLIHVLCFLAVMVLLILWGTRKENRQWQRLGLLAVMIGILPLAINCIYLFVSADPALTAIHTLVLYGFIAVYVFAVIAAEACDMPELFLGKWVAFASHLAQNGIALGMAVVIAINIYAANGLYLNLHLRYENAYAFYTALLADLKMDPQFQPGTKLAIIGTYQEPNFYWDEFEYVYRIMGGDGFNPDDYTQYHFMYYYVGLRMEFASQEEIRQIRQTEEFANMAVYPYHGSMERIGDTMVVKLSE